MPLEGAQSVGQKQVEILRSTLDQLSSLIQQATASGSMTEKTTKTPVGQAFVRFPQAHSIGVIGLGTGALACYGKPGQEWTFYEIDHVVEKIARNTKYFHYIENCGAGMKVVLGDGRLSVNDAADGKYDFLVIDARQRRPSRGACASGAFLQEDLDPGSGAGCDALGGNDGLGREIEQARGDDAGAEMGNDAGGMKAGVVEATFSCCADTDRGFHPRGVGHQ